MIFAFVNKGTGTYGLNATPIQTGDLLQFGSTSQQGVANETDPTVPSHVKNITQANINNWNSAFSWGNHAGLYRTNNWVPTWGEVTGKPNFTRTVPGLVPNPGGSGTLRFLREDGQWIEPPSSGSGGGGAETDPTVPSHVKQITSAQIANWNTAFNWGNHANAGYISQSNADTRYVPLANGIINAQGQRNFSNFTSNQVIHASQNSTGSTGFPQEFGATWSFSTNLSGNSSAVRGRAFDIWKRNVLDEFWIRGYNADSGEPNAWKRIWESSSLPNPVTGQIGGGQTIPRNIWVGTQTQYNNATKNNNTVYFII